MTTLRTYTSAANKQQLGIQVQALRLLANTTTAPDDKVWPHAPSESGRRPLYE